MNKLRYTLLLGFIALAALGNSLNATPTTLTICDGTGTDANLPVWAYNYDTYCQINQMIYPSSELTRLVGKNITKLTFYANGTIQRLAQSGGGSFNIKLGTTSSPQFGSTPSRITGLTTVATTNMSSYSGSNLIEITLDGNGYTYNGGNLVIEFNVTATGSWQSLSFYGVPQENASYYSTSSSQDGTYTATRKSFLPKVTFGYDETDPIISANPTQLSFRLEPNQTQTQSVTVTSLNLTGNISVTLNDANGVFSLNNTTSLPSSGGTFNVTYSPTAVGNHTATVTLTNGNVTETINLNGTCERYITVADGSDGSTVTTNAFLPIYAYYYDDCQKNQMIYPASMLTDLAGKTITSMTFYATEDFNFGGGQMTVRLGTTTNQDYYTSKTRLQTADMIIVKSGFDVPSSGNIWTIIFDDNRKFDYNGGNLVVDFEETSHGNGSGSYGANGFSFHGITHTGGGFYSNADTYDEVFSNVYSGGSVQNFLPKVRFAWEVSTPITSGTVTPAAIDFSTVGVGQSVSQTVTIKNTGNQDFVPAIATNLPAGSIFTVTGSGFDIANPPTMHPNDELVLTVTFTPTESTSYNGTITVTTVDGDNNPVAVGTVTLTGAGSIIYSGEVNPNPVNFGNVQVGQSATMTVTLTNTGNQPFTSTTIDASGLNGTGFSVTPTTSGALAPNGTQNFTVTFAPTAESFDNGTFTVTIPVPNGTPIVLTVNVTGNGYEYSPTTLMSNVTDMIPVHKSEAKAYGTYIFSQDEVDDDIDMNLSYDENTSGTVEVLVKNEEPVVNYTLKHKEGENGSWSNVGTATQDSSNPKVYAYNNETFTIPSDATEMWVPMTDNRVSGTTYYYVPVTYANGIVTTGNTYGAPQVQATNVNLEPTLSIGGSKSAGRPGGHWDQTVNGSVVDYCVYTPVISISPVYPQGAVPYLVRAWLLENEDIPFFTVTRVANTNDNNTHIEGGAELTYPHPLGEMELTSEMIGGTLTIGYDWDENNAGDAGSTIQPNAFAAPSEMPQGEITIAVRVYYYKADATQSGQKALRDGSEAPEDGYGYGEGSGSDQGIPTAVNSIYADREVVDVKYVNTMGMQSDKPFEGVNIVVTRYSDGSISTTKVLK